jgi:hypothetical protein
MIPVRPETAPGLSRNGQVLESSFGPVPYFSIMAVLGDPNYFVLLDHVVINTALFELPTATIGDRLYIVKFQAAGLESPKTEPIGVYHYAGIRRFIWKDKYYTEYALDPRPTMERAAELLVETKNVGSAMALRKLLDFLKLYKSSPAPNFDSTHDKVLNDPELRRRQFMRAIYEIP